MNKNRIVVKVGTSTLTNGNGKINLRFIEKLVRVISDLQNLGYEIILVSSGAIILGLTRMGIEERPDDVPILQAAAAVGQCELVHIYDKFFSEYGKTSAQILLDENDFRSKNREQDLANTFKALINRGIIPIVNENDSVSHSEIQSEEKVFGDNDTLSAMVSILCEAEKLIILSDVNGLYESDPNQNCDSKIISVVEKIDGKIWSLAGGVNSKFGTGGMTTKIKAAEIVNNRGIDMVIANGYKPDVLYQILDNEQIGTLFIGKKI